MTHEEYIKKWLDGSLSEAEAEAFKKTADYQELERLLRAVPSFKAPEYDVEARLKAFHDRKPAKGKVVRMNWVKPLLQAAAVFLIAAVGYFLFFYTPLTTIQALAGEKVELYLPDSSLVILNAGSQVAYHEGVWSDERQVELSGEAFFKVARGSKFDVITPTGTVSVLGTQFNVKHREDFFDVACYEGRVRVTTGTKTQQLSPGQGFRNIKGVLQEYTHSRELTPRWVDDESYFQSVPLYQVAQELERQYNLRVELKGVNNEQLFTGGFTHNDLTLALQSITLPLDLSYQVVDDEHIILSSDND